MVNYVVKNRFPQISATFADPQEAVFICRIVAYANGSVKFFLRSSPPSTDNENCVAINKE
jgi:hypothetical protein